MTEWAGGCLSLKSLTLIAHKWVLKEKASHVLVSGAYSAFTWDLRSLLPGPSLLAVSGDCTSSAGVSGFNPCSGD